MSGLQNSDREKLIEWLNSRAGWQSRVGVVIYMSVQLFSWASRKRIKRRVSLREAQEAWIRRLNEAASVRKEPPVSIVFPERASELGVDFTISSIVVDGRPRVEFAGVDIDSEAFLAFVRAVERGELDHLKFCENCERFFYARRRDALACSPECKVALWRKTPLGRERRKRYMRDYRAREKKREEKGELTGDEKEHSLSIRKGLGR